MVDGTILRSPESTRVSRALLLAEGIQAAVSTEAGDGTSKDREGGVRVIG